MRNTDVDAKPWDARLVERMQRGADFAPYGGKSRPSRTATEWFVLGVLSIAWVITVVVLGGVAQGVILGALAGAGVVLQLRGYLRSRSSTRNPDRA